MAPAADMVSGRKNWSAECKNLWRIAGPVILTQIFQFGLGFVTAAFVGHIGKVELAAVSIVNGVIEGLAFGLLLGMGSALETLCGQAVGAGQVQMLGVYMQRSWIICLATSLLLLPLYVFTSPVLRLLRQSPAISAVSGRYARWCVPQLFAYAVNFPIQKFYQAQSRVWVMTAVSGAVLGVHALLNWVVVARLGHGLVGAALVGDVSMWVLNAAQLVHVVGGWFPEAWTGFSRKAFASLGGFVRLSIASAVMLCLEMWYFTAVLILVGLLSNPEIQVGTISICMNYQLWTLMVAVGFNAAVSVRVSNELGANHPKAAKFSVVVATTTSAAIGLIFTAVALAARKQMPRLFSNDDVLVKETAKLGYLLAATIFLNSIQPVLSGVAIGAGWQSLVAFVNIGCYYLVGLPLGAVFGFKLKLSATGIWAGILIGTVLQTIILFVILARTKWQKERRGYGPGEDTSSCLRFKKLDEWKRLFHLLGGDNGGIKKKKTFSIPSTVSSQRLALATHQATPLPAGAAPTPAATAATSYQIQSSAPPPSQDPASPNPASTSPAQIPSLFYPSPEKLAWSSDEEDDEAVPDSPSSGVPRDSSCCRRPQLGGPAIPCPPGPQKSIGEERNVGLRGTLQLKSTVVVPHGAARALSLGEGGAVGWRRPSYKDVLLQRRPGNSQQEKSAGQRPHREYAATSEKRQQRDDSPPLKAAHAELEEGWQWVQRRRARHRTTPRPVSGSQADSDRQRLLRAAYLAKMRGRCFNCLARDHQVAQCRDPTKCWCCRRSGHISYRCPTRRETAGEKASSQQGQFMPGRSPSSTVIWMDQRHRRDDDGDYNRDGGHDDPPAPRRRGLLQRLRWAGEWDRVRERSPRRCHGESSSCQRGRQHAADRYLSPATRRSRERSLEREAHRVPRRTQHQEKARPAKTKNSCAFSRRAYRDETSDNGSDAGRMPRTLQALRAQRASSQCTKQMPDKKRCWDPILEQLLELRSEQMQTAMAGDQCQEEESSLYQDDAQGRIHAQPEQDPMREEAMFVHVTGEEKTQGSSCKYSVPEEEKKVQDQEHIEKSNLDSQSAHLGAKQTQPEEINTGAQQQTTTPDFEQGEEGEAEPQASDEEQQGDSFEGFVKKITKPTQPPVLNTQPKKKRGLAAERANEKNVRRSGRIASKRKATGDKHSEELAEEVLAKRLGNLSPKKNLTEEARNKLTRLFNGPISQEVMDAIEDLLTAMCIDTKKNVKTNKKGEAKNAT
ncbi:hypothetical protein EJB05_16856, partial [Eragrostis curvula]